MNTHKIMTTLLFLTLPGLVFAQISVVPVTAGPNDPLFITVESNAPGSWVDLLESHYSVQPGVIRIDATLNVGPGSFPEPYTVIVTTSPVSPGTYEIQYWSTYIEGGVTTGPTLEWTAPFLVNQAIPVPTLNRAALLVFISLISIAGLILLRKNA